MRKLTIIVFSVFICCLFFLLWFTWFQFF